MKPKPMNFLLLATLLLSGLAAGLFYAYSCSVNPGLKALPDGAYLGAMQSINRAIQNPVFFTSFLGLLLLYPATVIALYRRDGSWDPWLITAGAIYLVGVFGLTLFGNVPLNEQLDQFPLAGADSEALARMRHLFERPWNRCHALRTAASILSFAFTAWSIFKQQHR